MIKKITLITLLVLSLGLYLNRSYSRIYDRSVVPDLSPFWTSPISFKNPSFQNTVKYVAIGDSLTVGIGSLDIKKSLPYVFASKLSQQMSVTLTNIAVIGSTADDVIGFQLEKAATEKPNYVTVFIGTNDLHALVSPSAYEMKMNAIIDFLMKNTSAKIVVFNVPYLGSNSLVLFPYNVFFDYQIRQYNQAISGICKARGLKMIDLYTPTKNKFSKEPGFYSTDSFHPSGEGYLMWGTLINSSDF